MSLLRARLLRWLGRGRLEYDVGSARALPTRGADVIVPVYGAFDELRACLASVRRHTDLDRDGLVVVLDGPEQQPAHDVILATLGPPADRYRVLVNPRRLGFVGAVNRGMAASPRDVVLLNSDTLVSPGWLGSLRAAARAIETAASVTPFSNDATLCSLPRAFATNLLPAGHDLDGFAALVLGVSARSYPRLPTGVGVCLYLKRAALERVGPFDEGAFGLGYGEENDWCWRALQAGYVHVLDDAGFVWHAGHRSFGAERGALQRRAERALARRHPRYAATIAHHMRSDPLAPARERVLTALRPPASDLALLAREPEALRRSGGGASATPHLALLHIVHGWPPSSDGGTEHYARMLAEAQAAGRDVTVLARHADPDRPLGDATELQAGRLRVRLLVNNFRQRDPLARNALREPRFERELRHLLAETRPALAHVHHLSGLSLSLLDVLRDARLPIVYQLQDWWAACARVNLLDREHQPCPGPSLARCSRCFDLTRVRPRALTNRALHVLRRRWMGAALARPDVLVAGSQAVVDSHREFGLLPASKAVRVLEYPVTLPARRRSGAVTPPLRFGYVGALLPHKGPHIAVSAFASLAPTHATLDVWGSATGDPDYASSLRAGAGKAVRFNGAFDEARKAEVFDALDVLIVPSLGLESFALVAREAAARGVPMLASESGALRERIAEGCGKGFPTGDVRALRVAIEALIEAPSEVLALRTRLPPPRNVLDHVAEIEDVYTLAIEACRARS